MVQTQYNSKIKTIRSDNAPELAFSALLKEHGMLHKFSCAYTSQQNSIVERKHQHILNVARSLLFQSNIPLAYWSDCIVTTVFLINRLPSPLLEVKSPYELLTCKTPDYRLLKSFGCLCFVSTNVHERNKFSPRSKPCIVVFHEREFPFKASEHLSSVVDMFSNTILPLLPPLHFVETMHLFSDASVPLTSSAYVHPATSASHASTSTSTTHTTDSTTNVELSFDNNARPKRHTKAPPYLSEYHCSLVPFSSFSDHELAHPFTTPYHISSLDSGTCVSLMFFWELILFNLL